MPVLMPTARLWKQLGAPYPLAQVAPSADSVLGDWSLKSVDVRQGRFIVGVNERTLMAVVFAERPRSHLPSTLATCVGAQLEVFGIPPERITAEVAALQLSTFGKNRARSLVGILNEVTFQFEVAAGQQTSTGTSCWASAAAACWAANLGPRRHCGPQLKAGPLDGAANRDLETSR